MRIFGEVCQILADSRPSKCYKGQTHEPKDWEKLLYMMDSTTITLFDNILKGVGRHRNQARKRRHESTYSNEVSCRRTDGGAAHIRRKTRSLPAEGGAFAKDSTLAMDRGYVDIAQFQRLTEEGVLRDQNEEKP